MLEQNFRLVWRTLRGLGVPEAGVDDAAQHVFIVAADRLAGIELGKERAFLMQTAVRVAANARRSHIRRRHVITLDSADVHADPTPGPEELLSDKQAHEVLFEVLDTLSEDLRTVFVLFELEGMTGVEIGALLDIPAGTVASRLRRAREAFMEKASVVRARLAATGGEA